MLGSTAGGGEGVLDSGYQKPLRTGVSPVSGAREPSHTADVGQQRAPLATAWTQTASHTLLPSQ